MWICLLHLRECLRIAVESWAHILVSLIIFYLPHNTNYNHHESEDHVQHYTPEIQQVFNKDKWDERRKGGREGGKKEGGTILTSRFPSTMLWQHYQWVHALNSAGTLALVFLNHLLHTPPLTTSFFLKHLFLLFLPWHGIFLVFLHLRLLLKCHFLLVP